jgi:Domain of unknown function (DUF4349)
VNSLSQAVTLDNRRRRQIIIGGMILIALAGGYGLSLAGGGSTHSVVVPRSGQPFYALNAAPSTTSDGAYRASPQVQPNNRAHAPVRTGSSKTTASSNLPSNIIKTADLTLKVGHKKAVATSNDAAGIAGGLGGYVSYRTNYNHNTDIELEVRVPAQSFDFALKQIRALGSVVSESDNTQDVSLRVVDLGARLKNLEAQRNTLVSLFAKAKTVADTIRVQQVLSNVQGQVEQTQAQMRYLDNQTALATISLSIQTKAAHHHHHHHVAPNKIGTAFGSAGNGIVSVVAGTIVAVGYALPLAAIMFLGYGAFALARRVYLWRSGRRVVSSPTVA